jgi:hypothetical protein
MKAMIAVAAIAVSLANATTLAHADPVANTAIGTLAGLVVFGPVGAVAGAAVGYTAGNGIAHSWGLSRSHHRPARNIQRRSDDAPPMPRRKPTDSRPPEMGPQ